MGDVLSKTGGDKEGKMPIGKAGKGSVHPGAEANWVAEAMLSSS